MRTLIISDLHLGCGAAPGIFAGAAALAELLSSLHKPLRVVLNGDTFDFVAHDIPGGTGAIYLHSRALLEDARTIAVLTTLAAGVADRGELLICVGAHDRELALRPLQELLRGHMKPEHGASPRLRFIAGETPTRLSVGRARVLVTPGLHQQVDAGDLWLARHVLNPLRREFGVGLADLLRPDYPAAVLAALAVNPTAARQVFREPAGEAAWRQLTGATPVGSGLRLDEALTRAGLTERERDVMMQALDPEASAASHDRALDATRLKLFRAALTTHAGRPTAAPRSLSVGERAAAHTLATSGRAQAVITASTHAVGWAEDEGLVVVDTGAWTWLAVVPAADDDDAQWQRCLEAWQRTPRIGERPGLPTPIAARFTGALLEPQASGRGTLLALVEWRAGELLRLHEQALIGP